MEIPVSQQALTFAQGTLLGLGLCVCYDALRALRRRCPRGTLFADVLFGLLLAAAFLLFALTYGGGQFRLYLFLAVGLTAILFSDAEPGRGAAVSGAFFLAWQVCAGHFDARAFFSEISQKNFENPLCKMQKMVYNDL